MQISLHVLIISHLIFSLIKQQPAAVMLMTYVLGE
jgi:hypothetical protein